MLKVETHFFKNYKKAGVEKWKVNVKNVSIINYVFNMIMLWKMKKKLQIIIVEFMKKVFHQNFGMKKKNVKNSLKNKGIKVYYPLIKNAYMGII